MALTVIELLRHREDHGGSWGQEDGSRFPNELSLSAEKVDAKWIFTGVLRDITERKSLEVKPVAHAGLEKGYLSS